MKSTATIITELKRMTEGLEFISETESPFEVLTLEDTSEATPEYLRNVCDKSDAAPIVELTVDEFFAAAVTEQQGQSEIGRAITERFRRLVRFIKENLSDVRVYQIGERRKDILIIGRVLADKAVGLKTQVVET